MFSNDGYNFYDEHHMPNFDDQGHRYLFDFVAAELSKFEVLLDKFFSTMFDFVKLELTQDGLRKEFNSDYEKALQSNFAVVEADFYVPNVYFEEMVSILKCSHPYYKIGENARNIVKNIVIDYFHFHSSLNERLLFEDDYKEKVSDLLSIPKGFFPKNRLDQLYQVYIKCYQQSSSIRRKIAKGRELDAKYSLNIITFQQKMKELLFRILDISVPIINRLSIFERISLYKKIQSMPFSNADIQKLPKELSDFITAHPLHNSLHYDFAPEGNIKISIFETENKMYEKLQVESLEQLLEWEFIKMVQAGVRIKKCACCNRYFLVKDAKNNYCGRKFKGNKTCLDVGSNHRFYELKKNDVYYKAWRTAICRNRARITSKSNSISEDSFICWRIEGDRKLTDVRKDAEKSSESFFKWLAMTNDEIKEYEINMISILGQEEYSKIISEWKAKNKPKNILRASPT